jgi:diguanylate cyclase (GGDEF)-like protein/PAS domain S-box-containing protein
MKGNSSPNVPDSVSEDSHLENRTITPVGMELGQFAEILPFGLYLYHVPTSEILYANECLETIAGIKPQDMQKGVDYAFYSRIHPQDITAFLDYQKKSLEAGNSDFQGISYRLKSKENDWLNCRSRFSVYQRDEKGRCIEALATVEVENNQEVDNDIRKQSGSLHELILSQIPEQVFLFSSDGIIQYCNQAGAAYFNKDPFGLIGTSIYNLGLGEEFSQRFAHYLKKTVEFDETSSYRVDLLGEEGFKHLQYSLAPAKNAEGKILFIICTIRDIGAHIELENTLRQNDEKFRAILDTMTDGVLLWNQNLDCIWLNQVARKCPLTGPLAKGIVNLEDVLATQPDLWKRWKKKIMAVSNSGILAHSEDVLLLQHQKYWFSSVFLPVFNEDQEVETVALIFRDVTDEKRQFVERRIKDMAIESASSGIALMDMQGKITYFNQAFKTMHGYDDREVLGHSIFEYIADKRAAADIRRGILEEGRWNGEVDTVQKGHSLLPIQLSAHIVYDKKQNPLCIMITALDISRRRQYEAELNQYRNYLEKKVQERTHDLQETNIRLQNEIQEKRKAEIALQESEVKFRGLIERAEDIVFVVGLDGIVSQVNPAVTRLAGWSVEEVLNRYFDDFIYEEDHQRVMEAVRDLVQFQQAPYIEVRVKCKDGSAIPMEVAGTVLGNPGEPSGILGICRSLIQRKEMENKLRESERVARTLLNASPDASFLINNQGRILGANQSFLEMIKAWEDMAVGHLLVDVCPPSIWKDLQPGIDSVLNTNRMFQGLGNFKNSHYEIIIYPVIDESGQVFQMAAVIKDITAYKKTEKALQEMSLVDDLTGLYNRRGFQALAHQQLKIAKRRRTPMTLLFADLDQMKWINDNFGHLEGDWALREISSLLKQSFRESDIIARIGGDEFVVLMPQTSGIDADTLLKRLEENLGEYNNRLEAKYPLSISKGLAELDPASPCGIEELLAKADQKMYDEKNQKTTYRP